MSLYRPPSLVVSGWNAPELPVFGSTAEAVISRISQDRHLIQRTTKNGGAINSGDIVSLSPIIFAELRQLDQAQVLREIVSTSDNRLELRDDAIEIL